MPTPLDSAFDGNENENGNTTGSAAASLSDQRAHLRFDKMFTVRLESPLFGESYCIARNVSAGGIFLELPDPLPLGATVRVCFLVPDGSGDVVATGEVKNHYFINFTQGGCSRAVSGMAVRFTSFENEGHHILADCLSRMRVLH
ncbi:MAG TPA: PilZ domain-containing protein [Polyangia bacterium]|jgi:PilZ domain|nr:PilZ domain-containing protein [Polyangia bacterium]